MLLMPTGVTRMVFAKNNIVGRIYLGLAKSGQPIRSKPFSLTQLRVLVKTIMIAIDTETTGLNRYRGARPFGIGLCKNLFSGYATEYIDCPVDPRTRKPQWDDSFVSTKGRTLLEIKKDIANPDISKVFHNSKFDLHMLDSIGIEVSGKIHDTMLMARACYSQEKSYALKPLAKKYLNIDNQDEKDLQAATIKARALLKKDGFLPHGDVKGDYWAVKHYNKDSKLCQSYCELDVIRTLQLAEFYLEGMKKLECDKLYKELDMPLLLLLFEIEKHGIICDLAYLKKTFVESLARKNAIDKILLAKYKLENANSGQQVVKILLDLGIPLHERTKPSKTHPNGQLSTKQEVLERVDSNHIVLEMLKERNALQTGTQYFMNYLEHTSSRTSLLHYSLNLGTTRTWRLSSNDPNLQNIGNPFTSKNKYSLNGRKLFKPRPGYIWVALDYSQVELRIFGHVAQEHVLIDNYNAGIDGHEVTRSSIPFLQDMDQKIGRKYAKHANFTLIYGGSANTLFKKYGMPLYEGWQLVEGFRKTYQRGVQYQNETVDFASKHGHIITPYGRKVDTPEGQEYTTAVNYTIQSAAADLMKNGMLKCYDFISTKFSPDEVKIVLSIHDELIFEIRKDVCNLSLVKMLAYLMSDNNGVFCIDTPVDAALITDNWSEKEEIKL